MTTLADASLGGRRAGGNAAGLADREGAGAKGAPREMRGTGMFCNRLFD